MVELLCTLTGLVAGIAVVASILQHRSGRELETVATLPPSTTDATAMKNIADQLQMITFRVAADVSAHSQRVEDLNDRLEPQQPQRETIITAISDLVHLNQSMQDQLADAQKRLSQQSQQIEAAARLARTDVLTGLNNRRALDEFLTNCIQSMRPRDITGLLLLDIDHFKTFNDNYGHTTGDAVLASFAKSIMQWCGGNGYAARYGGEEFAIILGASTPDHLALRAAEVRRFISEQIIAYEDLRLTITSSAGLALLHQGDTIQQAYDRADEGLYRSKKAGRNCGHWLNDSQWLPFPPTKQEAAEMASVLAKQEAPPSKVTLAVPPDDENEESLPLAVRTVAADTASQRPTIQGLSDANKPDDESSPVLEMGQFLEKLDTHMEQLRRAELPATALMIEAYGLDSGSPNELAASWSRIVELVQHNLRGIDLLSHFRKGVMCAFLPGCSADATIERAGRMLHAFERLISEWPSDHPAPTRLGIALATFRINEERGDFLQRLEHALEETQDAKSLELVVQDGHSCHFQQV